MARVAGFGVVAFAFTEAGHALTLRGESPALPPIAFSLGLLLAVLHRTPQWSTRLLLLVSAGLANLASDWLVHGQPLTVSLGGGAIRLGEACYGSWMLQRMFSGPVTLTRLIEVLGMTGVCALLGPALGATVGAGLLSFAFDGISYGPAWRMWWIADALGVLIITPVILSWTGPILLNVTSLVSWRMMERFALFAGLIAVMEGVYGEYVPPPWNVPAFILPFLLWAAVRFSPFISSIAVLLVALIGLAHIAQGHGPFAVLTTSPSEQMLRAQGTLMVISLSVMLLAAAVAERRTAEQLKLKLIEELESALNEIKTLQGLIPLCSWCRKMRNDQGYWQSLEVYMRAHTDAKITHGICPQCMDTQIDRLSEVDEAQPPARDPR
jgi:integral membrane sensor domain MASE1